MIADTSTSRKALQIFLAVLLLGAFLIIFSPFWMPILMAGIFALGIEPGLGKVGNRFNMRLRVNAWAYILCLFFFIFLPVAGFVFRAISALRKFSEGGIANSDIYTHGNELKTRAINWIGTIEAEYQIRIIDDVEKAGSDLFKWVSDAAVGFSSSIISAFPNFLLSLGIFLITLYIFLREKRAIKNFFMRTGFLNINHSREVIQITQNACASTLVASLVTGIAQAVVVCIGAAIFKAGDLWMIFLATFFMSFIPAIGAGPVCIALALPFLLKSEIVPVIGLTVFAVIAGTVDNLIRPYVVGSGEDVHPFLMFLSSIGGILVFGFPGLFIGPVVAVVTIKVLPILLHNLTQ